MYPETHRYTDQHEWLLETENGFLIGITHHAQSELGDIVYVELPEAEESFKKGDEFGSLESVKAVAEVYIPISGEIVEVNSLLEDNPELVNQNPHESGWLIKVKPSETVDLGELMTAAQYADFVGKETK